MAVFADSKSHYNILNGLRGVAAIMVLCFHIFEAFATSHLDQRINHGYLAVDFFFILSGFVIAYAYDDRWGTMKIKDFVKRRIIRLHPMVVMGALIGGALFYFQGFSGLDVSTISVTAVLIATLMSALLIPAAPGTEIRGFQEMFPLNGPSWTLLFEYMGNILYVLFIRRFSTKVLIGFIVAAGCGLATFALLTGDICAGFALTGTQFAGGSLRLLFSFSMGLLLSRIFKSAKNIKGAFWLCGLVLIILLAIPRIGGAEHLWMNGLYDTLCCVVFFPLLVYFGASGKITDKYTTRICQFLGDLSYPLYVVHYPIFWLYYAWVKDNNLTFEQSLPGAAGMFIGSILLAVVCMKLYDIPVRKYLTKLFFKPVSR